MLLSVEVDYQIEEATLDHVDFLSTRLREMDLREIDAVSGRSEHAVLISGLKMSEICRVGMADGVPICMYGVRRMSLLSTGGIIWMLGTDDLKKHAMKFGRECGIQVKEMFEGFDLVENWCLADNKLTIRWLKWLGFKFDDPEKLGRRDEMFQRFYMGEK